jgi:hypothetical protein
MLFFIGTSSLPGSSVRGLFSRAEDGDTVLATFHSAGELRRFRRITGGSEYFWGEPLYLRGEMA